MNVCIKCKLEISRHEIAVATVSCIRNYIALKARSAHVGYDTLIISRGSE